MTAYAVGLLRNVCLNDGIKAYLHGIDATLAPYEGCFIIHGAKAEPLEGTVENDLIVIRFPSLDKAREWYSSAAYQALIPLRQQGAAGAVFLINGVSDNHRATDIL